MAKIKQGDEVVVVAGKEMVVESYKVIDEKLSNALLAIK